MILALSVITPSNVRLAYCGGSTQLSDSNPTWPASGAMASRKDTGSPPRVASGSISSQGANTDAWLRADGHGTLQFGSSEVTPSMSTRSRSTVSS